MTAPGYADLAAEAQAKLELARYRRRRFHDSILGWLHQGERPRLATFGAFLLAVTASFFLVRLGLSGRVSNATQAMTTVMTAWPVFLILLCKYASWLLKRLDPENDANHVLHRAAMATPYSAAELESEEWRRAKESFRIGAEAGIRTTPNGPLAILILGVATLGCWFAWELIKSGAPLATDLLLDRELPKRYPNLWDEIAVEPWFQNLIGVTLLFFIGITGCAWVTVGAIELTLPISGV